MRSRRCSRQSVRVDASVGKRRPGSRLRVVDPYHLVAFKLYAGGTKSTLYILELLDRRPTLDIEQLRKLCVEYRLDAALDRVLSLPEE